MRKINIYMHGINAGTLLEIQMGTEYKFEYKNDYVGPAISLTMPTTEKIYFFNSFPAFFDGLLPEGNQLEGLLRHSKIDRNDLLSQLITVGVDLVGALTVEKT